MADSGDSESKLGWATAGVWISVVLLLLIIFGQIFGWWESLRSFLSGMRSPSLPGTRTWFGWFGGLFAAPMNLFKNFGGVVTSVLVAVVLLIPDTAVLGGFVADLANGEARYSVTSAFGLLAALLNWFTMYFGVWPDTATRHLFGAEAAAAVQAAATAAGVSGAAAAAGMFGNPNGVVGIGSPAAATPPPAAPPAAPPTLLSAITAAGGPQGLQPAAAAPSPGPDPLTQVRSASAAASIGRRNSVSTLGTTMGMTPPMTGRGRRVQTGGASYSLNPSSILGIPLGSKAQPAGLAVIVAIAVIYCMDAIFDKRKGLALAFQVIFAIAIVCGYTFSYYKTEGFGENRWWIPLVIGAIVGLIGFFSLYYGGGKRFLPLDPEDAGPPTGEYSKCAKAAGGGGGGAGEYVCDAYLNGQRIGTVSS